MTRPHLPDIQSVHRPSDSDPGCVATDALRGAAILAVFALHAILELNVSPAFDPASPESSPPAPGFLGALVGNPVGYCLPGHLGHFGVQLFFVLSGFCIHLSQRRRDLAAPGPPRWRDFLARRFWRVYPLYALVLAALAALGAGPAAADGPTLTETLGVHALMAHTLVPDHVNLLNPSFWSLAVEAQWYLLYPLVWLAFRRFRPSVVVLVAAVIGLAWAFKVPLASRAPWLVNLPCRWALEWVLGAFVAEMLMVPTPSRGPPGWFVAAFGTLTLLVLLPTRVPLLYATLPPITFALLVAWAARIRSIRPLWPIWQILARLGVISYALYLIHQPLFSAAADLLVDRQVRAVDLAPFLIVTALVFIAAIGLAAPLERLGRAIQRRYPRAAAPPSVPRAR